MSEKYCPDRGHIIWINFDPKSGHEQMGRRPAIILSPKSYNSLTQLAIVCPITKSVKGYPFEVPIPEKCRIEGVVLSDHIKSLDWLMRNAEFICIAPPATLDEVINKANTLLS